MHAYPQTLFLHSQTYVYTIGKYALLLSSRIGAWVCVFMSRWNVETQVLKV